MRFLHFHSLSNRHTHLLSPVDHVFGVGEAAGRGTPYNGVMTGWGVSHLHGAELEEALSQADAAEEELSMARVTGPVLMDGAARPASDPVHVLIAF